MMEQPVQDDHPHEKCAVFGIYKGGPSAARLAFYGLSALQHRGQESTGIVSSASKKLYRHIAPGLVSHAYQEEDIVALPGSHAIGHNRYSTSGGSDDAHRQPVIKYQPNFALAHNGNFPVTDQMEAFLDARDIVHEHLNDSELMTEVIHCYLKDGCNLEQAIGKAYPLLEGAFSVVVLSDEGMAAFRDPYGIRPLCIGSLGKGYVVASETCALDAVGATFVRDVRPGELVICDKRGLTSQQLVKGTLKLDIFEFVYFARPDSVIEGQSVYDVRRKMGVMLAKEQPVAADVVVPVPDSAIPAALGYATTLNIPFELALMKNRYIHRTFIRPQDRQRQQDLHLKLNPIAHLLKGKRVALVDDSIVRGTTMKKTAHMLYQAGAKEVHILVSSPPVRYPDFYGIDLPRQEDLLAANKSLAEMAAFLGVDSLRYLSQEGMVAATGFETSSFSMACFDGVYPLAIGTRRKHITTPDALETKLKINEPDMVLEQSPSLS